MSDNRKLYLQRSIDDVWTDMKKHYFKNQFKIDAQLEIDAWLKFLKENQEYLQKSPSSCIICGNCGKKIHQKFHCTTYDVCYFCDEKIQPLFANPLNIGKIKEYFPELYLQFKKIQKERRLLKKKRRLQKSLTYSQNDRGMLFMLLYILSVWSFLLMSINRY